MENLNLNQAECIKYATHFGYTHYQNICSGATFDVAWGGVDWLGFLALGLLCLMFLGWMLGLAALIIADSLL